MKVFSSLSVEIITIVGKRYAKVTLQNMNKPSMSLDDFYLIERYDVPLSDAVNIYNAYIATSTQSFVYYMDGKTYMSSNIFMGGVNLGYEPVYLDIRKQVESGTAVLVDTTSNPDKYLHIYRAVSLNIVGEVIDESSTQYVMLTRNIYNTDSSQTSTAISVTIEKERTRARIDRNGNYVIMGVPSPHGNPRYKGVIESANYKAVIKSIVENDTMVKDDAETLKTEITDLISKIVNVGMNTGRVICHANVLDILEATSYSSYMNPFIYMNKNTYMKEPKENS